MEEFPVFGRRSPAEYYFLFPLRGSAHDAERVLALLTEHPGRHGRVMPQHLYSSEIVESYLDDFVHYTDAVVAVCDEAALNSTFWHGRPTNAVAHAHEIGKRVVAFVRGDGTLESPKGEMTVRTYCTFDQIWWYQDDDGLQTAVRRELATELLYAAPDQNRRADAGEVARVIEAYERLFTSGHVDVRELCAMTPRQFERFIGDLWQRFKYEVELTARTRDGGYDVVAVKNDETPIRILIECKLYAPENHVGVQVVRSLYGVKTDQRATKAIVATTSTFTPAARRLQEGHEWELELRDYEGILKWVKKARVDGK